MSPKLPRVSGKDTISALFRAGFVVVRIRGSHYFLSHRDDPTRWATVPFHGKDILPVKVIKSILSSSKITIDQFIDLL